MELVRSMIMCGRGARRDGYTELVYDDKMAPYSDNEPYYSQDEPYTQHNAMTYSGDDSFDAASITDEKEGELESMDPRTVEELADIVARLLWRAEWNDDGLQYRITEAVGDRCWNRKMVEECLDNVIEYVERGRTEMGDAMCVALDKVTDIADEEFAFPRRHPESLDGFIAIVSVGVLAEMQGAWVLELLGFGDVSGREAVNGKSEVAMFTSDKISYLSKPRAGSVAAWWTREYGAYIPEGSVYSYLRRLDMVEED